MKINFQTQNAEIAEKDRTQIEKKLSSLRKFLTEEPTTVDVHVIGHGAGQKQSDFFEVHLNLVSGKDQLFVEEKGNSLMKVFAIAFKRLRQSLMREHHKRVKNDRFLRRSLDRVLGLLRRGRRKKEEE